MSFCPGKRKENVTAKAINFYFNEHTENITSTLILHFLNNYSEETGFRCIAEGLGCKNVIAEFSNFLKVILLK